MDPLTAAAAAAMVANTVASFFQKRPKAPDITGELNNLRALIDEQRQSGLKAIDEDYGNQRAETATNLATRGIYRSPVSQNSFDRLGKARASAKSSFLGDLAGREATLRAGLYSGLLSSQQAAEQLRAQQNAARFGQAGSLFSALLMASLNRQKPEETSTDGTTFPNSVMDQPGSRIPIQGPPVPWTLQMQNLYSNLINPR